MSVTSLYSDSVSSLCVKGFGKLVCFPVLPIRTKFQYGSSLHGLSTEKIL